MREWVKKMFGTGFLLVLLTGMVATNVWASGDLVVNILVAYDEEMANTEFSFWTSGGAAPLKKVVSTQEYCEIQIRRGVWRFSQFNLDFDIIGFTTWESDDSLHWISDLLEEMRKEVRFVSGMLWEGRDVAHVLVGFTNQEGISNNGGMCNVTAATCIIQHLEDWTDDNVVMHEVSHVFGAEHCEDVDCVMSGAQVFVTFYNEPLEPVCDGSVLLNLWQTQRVTYFSYNWCPQARSEILANRERFNDNPGSNPGHKQAKIGKSDPLFCVDAPPYNPPTILTYILRYSPVLIIFFSIMVLVAIYYHRKRRLIK